MAVFGHLKTICSFFLLLVFSSSFSAMKCYGGASMRTNSPLLKEKYGKFIDAHRNTEFTNCKEYCMTKDVRESYPKDDWILYGYAGCGDEDCKDRPRNETKRCIESVENSTTAVRRVVFLCCCKGDHCFKREDFGLIENHEPIVERPTKASSNFFHFVFFVFFIVISINTR